MIELPEQIDYNIKVTHHCELFNMNEDPMGNLYFATLNQDTPNMQIDLKRQEVNVSKDGTVTVIVFYDKYEKIPKAKPSKRKTVESELC